MHPFPLFSSVQLVLSGLASTTRGVGMHQDRAGQADRSQNGLTR